MSEQTARTDRDQPELPDVPTPLRMLKEAGGVLASSVAPSENSTSTVVTVAKTPQIQLGRTKVNLHRDVRYAAPELADGTARELKLDIQVPDLAGRKPLVLYITGGGFLLHRKENALDLRTFVAEAGYVVASIDYRTINDGAIYLDGLADVRFALRFLFDHAREYEIDPERVALWGESAGGYLATLAGLTIGQAGDLGDETERPVRGVISKFGLTDFSLAAADFDETTQRHYAGPECNLAWYQNGRHSGKSVTDDPEAARRANPLTYVTSSVPPFLFLHGSADTVVSPTATLVLHDALQARGVDSTRYVLEGANHGDAPFLGDLRAGEAWSTQQVMGYLVDFLDTHVRP